MVDIMHNTRAFYELSKRRQLIEEQLQEYNTIINGLRSDAKKLKKGSIERQELMTKANDLKNYNVYIKLETELKTLNFCINTVFYG